MNVIPNCNSQLTIDKDDETWLKGYFADTPTDMSV